MGYTLRGYDALKESVMQAIKDLCKHHRCDTKYLESGVKNLPDSRRVQAHVLLKIVTFLEHSKQMDSEKSRVLTSAIVVIHQQVKDSYTYFSPKNSQMYNLLSMCLDLTQSNGLDKKDLYDLYCEFNRFLCSVVYVDSDPCKGYLDQPLFLDQEIKGYRIEENIKTLDKKMCKLKGELIEDTQYRYKLGNGLFSSSLPKDNPIVNEKKQLTHPVK